MNKTPNEETENETSEQKLNAIGYAKFYSRSHNAVIRVYDEAGNVMESTSAGRVSENSSGFVRIIWRTTDRREALKLNLYCQAHLKVLMVAIETF